MQWFILFSIFEWGICVTKQAHMCLLLQRTLSLVWLWNTKTDLSEVFIHFLDHLFNSGVTKPNTKGHITTRAHIHTYSKLKNHQLI